MNLDMAILLSPLFFLLLAYFATLYKPSDRARMLNQVKEFLLKLLPGGPYLRRK